MGEESGNDPLERDRREICQSFFGHNRGSDEPDDSEPENEGTMILDATCAPQQISFPQDTNLLNEARENLENSIDTICYEYNEPTPRMYRRNARKDFLNFAKCKKRTAKKIRKAIKKQLQYIKRDFSYIDAFLEKGNVELTQKQTNRLSVQNFFALYDDFNLVNVQMAK